MRCGAHVLLPGLVVVISKVGVLPSVRRSVIDLCSSLSDFGLCCGLCSCDGCRVALHHCFQLPRLRFVWWARPFLEWPCLAGCVAVRVHSISRLGLDALLECFLVLCEGKFKGKDKSCEVPQSSVGFRIIPVQVPASVGSWEQQPRSATSWF